MYEKKLHNYFLLVCFFLPCAEYNGILTYPWVRIWTYTRRRTSTSKDSQSSYVLLGQMAL